MDICNQNKILGAIYYEALMHVKKSNENYKTARNLLYILGEYNRFCDTAEDQRHWDEKYQTILNVLTEFTMIEERNSLIGGRRIYRFLRFDIPQDICEKLNNLRIKIQAEKMAETFTSVTELKRKQAERKQKICDNLDKLL